MLLKRVVPVLLLAIGIATAPQAVRAQDHVIQAQIFVEQLAQHAVAVLSRDDLTPAQRRDEFRLLFQEGFAINGIAKFALGRHWYRASEAEREEYLDLFEATIVNSWANRLGNYSGRRFEVIDAKDVPTGGGEKAAIVRSMIWTGPTSTVRVNWRVASNGETYKITDVIIAGVSMANTHRDEFASVIRRNGNAVAGLNAVLRERSRG